MNRKQQKTTISINVMRFIAVYLIVIFAGTNRVFGQENIKGADQKITNAQKLGFPAGKKVILLHIDDAGMCDEANKSTEFYLGNGFVPSAAVMMPCEYAEDMVNWAKKNPSKDIGIHLTLTSEWKTYRWGTVADPKQVPGLLDPDKKMWRSVESVVKNASPKEVETEIRAQIEKMIAMGHRPTHMDTHMGTLYGSPAFARVFLDMAQEYQIPANAIDVTDPRVAGYFREAGYPITDEVIEMMKGYTLPKLDFFTSVPDGKSYEEKRDNFFKLVSGLENGLTEIIFHSSFETENLKSITGSWQQRVWEAKLFSDPVVIKFFEDNGIIQTNWIEIMQRYRERQK
jgi:chitin disaccharide deacetylase